MLLHANKKKFHEAFIAINAAAYPATQRTHRRTHAVKPQPQPWLARNQGVSDGLHIMKAVLTGKLSMEMSLRRWPMRHGDSCATPAVAQHGSLVLLHNTAGKDYA
jgi:hypothetical protein